MVAEVGQQAPGSEPGITIDQLFDFRINDSGDVAFEARTSEVSACGDDTCPNILAFFTRRDGVVQQTVREDGPVPGADPSVAFDTIRGLDIDDSANTIFRGRYFVDGRFYFGIYEEGPNGLQPIIKTGDLLEVRPDDLRTVDDVSLRIGSAGPSLNGSGQVTFVATFTEGQRGVFLSTPVVPEPSTAALIGYAALALAANRRR